MLKAEEKTIKTKLVTNFIEKAGDGAQVFGVTFQQDGSVGQKGLLYQTCCKERLIVPTGRLSRGIPVRILKREKRGPQSGACEGGDLHG